MRKIIHAVNLYGTSERHLRAQASWGGVFTSGTYMPMLPSHRDSWGVGDHRKLPYLKDLLAYAAKDVDFGDIVFWSSDDIILDLKLPAFLRYELPVMGACGFRRTEPGVKGVHCGRDAFAFTKEWLADNFDSIPDYICSAAAMDIGLIALIRLQHGVVTTKANLSHDLHSCDVGEGWVFHEPHESSWAGENENSPSNQHNRALLRAWMAKNIPQSTEELA